MSAAGLSTLDPDLIGIWIAPGNPATFEVDASGAYHIADPERPLSFARSGAVMTWGDARLERQSDAGETPVGAWLDPATGAVWQFDADYGYRVEVDGLTDTGIWALRDGGASLWVREKTAEIGTDGAHVEFRPMTGPPIRYAYTVSGGVWQLFDPSDWTGVARYIRPENLLDKGQD